ncbi:MAG: hypothetical protein GKS00_19680 [Alphaproteobacteria bacterium]|nr:hypothetical protein [Alphaproteobacteria bacterium]
MITLSPQTALHFFVLLLALGTTACQYTTNDPELLREIQYIEDMSPGS